MGLAPPVCYVVRHGSVPVTLPRSVLSRVICPARDAVGDFVRGKRGVGGVLSGEPFLDWVWQLFILPMTVCSSWPVAAVVVSIAASRVTVAVANNRAQPPPSKAVLWVPPVSFGSFAAWMRSFPLGGDQIRIDLVLWSLVITPLTLIQIGTLAYVCLRRRRGPEHS